LVITLIFVTAMAAAAVAFLAGRQSDALTLRGQLQAVEAQAMLDAALRQTIVLLANREPRQSVPDRLVWRFGEVAVQVRFEDEAGKVDLNAAEDRLLRALSLALGLEEGRAEALADAVQDWRDENQLTLDFGAEDREYRSSSTVTSGAADRPFAHPAELRYLPSIDPAAWALFQPHLTVYSGSQSPDARRASGPVRRAMEIARGLPEDEPEQGQPEAREDASERSGDSSSSDSSGSGREAAGLSGQPAIAGTLSRRDEADQGGDLRSRRGTASLGATDRDEAESGAAAAAAGGAGGGGEEAPQTVFLGVRFPNGYEAAARAVIALAGNGEQGPPYMVLDWTPVLRGGGVGS
jgi:general secretion pathway protein K